MYLYFNTSSFVQLEGIIGHLSLFSTLDFVRVVDGQSHLHFVARGGDGNFIDLGKTLADVHKRFVLGFRQDEKKVDGRRDAEYDEHQEGKGLQRLLHRWNKNKKKHRQE